MYFSVKLFLWPGIYRIEGWGFFLFLGGWGAFNFFPSDFFIGGTVLLVQRFYIFQIEILKWKKMKCHVILAWYFFQVSICTWSEAFQSTHTLQVHCDRRWTYQSPHSKEKLPELLKSLQVHFCKVFETQQNLEDHIIMSHQAHEKLACNLCDQIFKMQERFR